MSARDVLLPLVVGVLALLPFFALWRWQARRLARRHPDVYADGSEAAAVAFMVTAIWHAVIGVVWAVGWAVLAVLS